MTAKSLIIEQSIRELPTQEMVILHEHLIELILERAEEDGMEPTFQEEIKQRVESIKDGSAKTVDAFESLKKM